MTSNWTRQHTLYALVSAWCVLAAYVCGSALNFFYHHPDEFLRCGGPCRLIAANPCVETTSSTKTGKN